MTLKLQDITDALDIARDCGCSPSNPITPMMEIDWDTAEVTFYGLHQSERGSTNMRDWHGHSSTWPLPAVSALAIQAAVEELLPLIRAASAQYYAAHDGSNYVASWRDIDAMEAAQRAHGELPNVHPDDTAIGQARRAVFTMRDELGHLDFVGFWAAGDWMEHDDPEDIGVRLESTDEELNAAAVEIVGNAVGEGALLDKDDVWEHLELVRDRLASECGSGQITGVDCAVGIWDDSDLAIVEWMPLHLRASHQAARNSGVYPNNGADRIRCCADCAAFLVEDDPDWTEIIKSA